ncbi:MAG TPA: RNA methyltransferase [Frankiaceae bacterium]|nr:RNA methyltransferase [Frankiaceae bacterium]
MGARRLARRATRRSEGRFLVEGPGAVEAALATDGLVELFATPEAAERHPHLTGDATLVTGKVMEALAQTVSPQGLVGVALARDVPLADALAKRPLLVAVLAYARDPGNAGTILRTADAAGAELVVFPDESVDPYNPKCVRSSAGSIFHVDVVDGGAVPDVLAALREAGLTVRATTADAGTPLDEADLTGPTAWVFGNEAWGMPEDVITMADERVRVPIYGRAESLNLATAAAVCLYASAKGQRDPGGCRT